MLVGALSQATERLKFVTTVYIPAMRDPYSAAKAIGTAAVLSGSRVELGIGVGWCEEEFDLLGQPFAERGKRTDEMLELFKALWQPGWTEFDRGVLPDAATGDDPHAAADPHLFGRVVRYRPAPGRPQRRLDR